VFTGKRFTLEQSTIAVEFVDGKRNVVIIPKGAVIEAISGGPRFGLVTVFWEARKVAIFSADLKTRAIEITDRIATA
jgi:hypothetical protein